MRKWFKEEKGMTLIEVLLALIVFGILSVILMGSIPSSLKISYIAGEKSKAVQIAQDKMDNARLAQLTADLIPNDPSVFPSGFAPVPAYPGYEWKVEFTDSTATMAQVIITVRWLSKDNQFRNYTLVSLRQKAL